MKLDHQTLEYLEGKKFSNSYSIQYSYNEPIPNRVELLTEITKQKKVIHIGCLDHLPLIDQKVKVGQWLHKELSSHASKCLGIDINEEAHNYVKNKYGVSNIVLRDITAEPIPEIMAEKWDYAILGELLEHIDNPVHYLSEIKKKYKSSIDRLIITVPNVLNVRSLEFATKSMEVINSDHRYWFTPYTIAKVALQAGMELDEIYFANRVRLSTYHLIKQKLLKMVGVRVSYGFQFSSSIVLIGKLA